MSKKKKEIAVLGLGDFGSSLAVSLAEGGASVLAVDRSEESVQAVAERVDYAVRADLEDPEVLPSLGIRKMDMVIVCIGTDLLASIMSTVIAKEKGVPFVMAKAHSDIHATMLKKLGADRVIFPEKDMGVRVARNLLSGNFMDMMELSVDSSIVEFRIPERWNGKTLRTLNLRAEGLNVIAKISNGQVSTVLDPDRELQQGDVYYIIGTNKAMEQLMKE